MNSKKKGLGKGLSALFGDQKKPENTSKNEQNIQKALIGELARNKYQDDDQQVELVINNGQKYGQHCGLVRRGSCLILNCSIS